LLIGGGGVFCLFVPRLRFLENGRFYFFLSIWLYSATNKSCGILFAFLIKLHQVRKLYKASIVCSDILFGAARMTTYLSLNRHYERQFWLAVLCHVLRCGSRRCRQGILALGEVASFWRTGMGFADGNSQVVDG